MLFGRISIAFVDSDQKMYEGNITYIMYNQI